MTSPTLLSLADRVESLTKACRETDILIGYAVDLKGDDKHLTFRTSLDVCGMEQMLRMAESHQNIWRHELPRYTASRDAAVSLRLDWMSLETTESAPEPQFTRCRIWDWRRSPTMSDPGNEWKAEGNRPLPLNICSAILRARSALEASHD